MIRWLFLHIIPVESGWFNTGGRGESQQKALKISAEIKKKKRNRLNLLFEEAQFFLDEERAHSMGVQLPQGHPSILLEEINITFHLNLPLSLRSCKRNIEINKEPPLSLNH